MMSGNDAQTGSIGVYEAVCQNITEPVCVFTVEKDNADASFFFNWNNTAHSEQTGITTDSHGNQPVDDFLNTADAAAVSSQLENCLNHTESVEQTETITWPAATVSWETTYTPVVKDGAVEAIVATSQTVSGTVPTNSQQSDHEAQQHKQRLELAVEGAGIGVWDWNMSTDHVEYNEQWASMLGYTLDEIEPHLSAWETRTHPEDVERIKTALRNHKQLETEYYDTEHRMKTAGGDWKWVRDIGTIVEWDDHNNPLRAVGIHIDIDQQKTTQQALESERDLFKQGPAIVFRWKDEAGWPIEHVSDNVESTLGYSPEELQSTEFATLVHNEDIQQVKQIFREEQQSGSTQFNPDPYRIRDADGNIRWVIEYTNTATRETKNTSLVGYLIDITDQKQQEQEIKAREQMYRNLFEDNRDALMLMDREGYLDCNEQVLELFGFESVGEFVEHSPWEFSPATQPDGRDSRTAALDRINEAFEEGEAFFEWTHQRADGTEFPAEVKLTRFEYGDQPVVHSLVRDISERKERQQELISERNRIRAISEALPDVVIVLDRDGTYQEVLTGQEALLIDDASKLVGSTVTEILPPDVGQSVVEAIEESLNTDSVSTVEYSLELGGEQTYFEGRIAPIQGEMYDELVLLARNITDRIEYERELELREEKYRSLFEDTRDALMLVDRNGFFDCNEQTLDLFEIDSVETFTEYTPWELAPPTQPGGSKSKKAALEHIETAFDEGEAFFEWIHQRPDGTTFTAEVKLSRFDHQGNPAVHAIVRDISDRKARERQLKQFRKAVEQTGHAVYITETDGTIKYVNQAFEEITGYGRPEAISSEPGILNSGEHDESFHQELWETILAGDQWESEVIDERADGEEVVLNQTISPLTDDEGNPEKFVAVAHDVTQRKVYERQLEEQRDNLDILNQVLRHDIRNNLQLILAYAEMLQDKINDDEAQMYLETVLENADHAVDLTKVAREMAAVMLSTDQELEPISIRSVVTTEVEQIRDAYPEAAITTEAEIHQASVRANEMLASVFRNLLKNAIQHNDKEVPKITVSSVKQQNQITIRVADNGPGVSDAAKEDIFGKGEKGLDSDGTGIGLYLVKSLVETYGGDVWVEDREKDSDQDSQSPIDTTAEGAVFVVELPTVAGE